MVTLSLTLVSSPTLLEVITASDPTSADTYTPPPPSFKPLMDHSTHKHTHRRGFFSPASVLFSQPPPQTGNLSFHSSSYSSGPHIPLFFLYLFLHYLLFLLFLHLLLRYPFMLIFHLHSYHILCYVLCSSFCEALCDSILKGAI